MALNLRPIYNRGDALATDALHRRLHDAFPVAAVAVVYDEAGDAVRVNVAIDGYDADAILNTRRFVTAIDDLPGVERDLTVKGEIHLSAPISRLPELLKAMTRLREISLARVAQIFDDISAAKSGHPKGDRYQGGR